MMMVFIDTRLICMYHVHLVCPNAGKHLCRRLDACMLCARLVLDWLKTLTTSYFCKQDVCGKFRLWDHLEKVLVLGFGKVTW